MYERIFTELGLSQNESKIYESLINSGEASIEEISLNSKVHRRNVYDIIKKLIEKGLISEIISKQRKEYKAINPRRLLDILQEKENKLNSILPKLEKEYISKEEKDEAYFYRGIQGFKNYLQDILKTKETVYFIGAKAFWLDPRLKHFFVNFKRERKRLGIKFKHIFDYEVKEKTPEILKIVGKPYKFFPKEYSSQTAIDIFGPYVVSFVGVSPGKLNQEPLQFVMKSKRLAEGYKKYFEFIWNSLPEEEE